ncbi:hypothetical protein HK102_011385 [Quaeritorhiza haematococci]|nr:hypothetical protein HK102_011385 [Quaeritorhiza haematococci]
MTSAVFAASKLNPLIKMFEASFANIENGFSYSTDAAAELAECLKFSGEHAEEDQKLIQKLEDSIYTFIDLECKLAAQKESLQNLHNQLTRAAARRNAESQQELPHVIDTFEEHYKKELDKWDATPANRRYATHDKYREFNKQVWEAQHPGQKYAPDAEEDDEDLVVMDQTQSFKCPITQAIMDKPYTSKVCKHSFSSAVINFIKESRSSQIECPVAGCQSYLKLADLAYDRALARKIAKSQASQASEDDDEETAVVGMQ